MPQISPPEHMPLAAPPLQQTPLDPRDAWSALEDPGVAQIILQPRLTVSSADIETVLSTKAMLGRWMGPLGTVDKKVRALFPSSFAQWVSALLSDYHAFMTPDVLRLRIEAVTGKACSKWHRDYTTLRLITTLKGPGTQVLCDPNAPDAITHCPTGAIGLFKGRLFSGSTAQSASQASVHRSPPPTDEWDERLLVVIDTPQDFEIEQGQR